MATLIQDLRYGLRVLRNSPGFAAIAVLTLAFGIGANVAIFSFVDELWLHPIPVPHPERLVRIFTSSPTSHGEVERGLNSIPDFVDLRAGTNTLSGVALLQRRGAFYDDGSQNRFVSVAVISDNFFDVLQPSPILGRIFTEAELRSSGSMGLPVVISYPFWQRAFNGDPGIAGRSIVLNRQSVVVVGILPRGFRGTQPLMVPDVWIPFTVWYQQSPDERAYQTQRESREYEMFGRLREGAVLQQARVELSGIAGQLARAYPKTNTGRRIAILLEDNARGDGLGTLGVILLGIAGMVLLIACANVAGLLIARSESRRREIATRIALGGSRTRIVSQLVTETIMVALAGGVAALLLGHAALKVLPSLMPPISFPVGVDAYIGRRTLLMTAATVVVSLFLCGLTPALLATKLAPLAALRPHGGESGKLRVLTRSILVTGQVALSLVLTVCTGLLVLSFLNGLTLDPGFNAHQELLVADFGPEMKTNAESMRLTDELRRHMESLPGVTGTAAAQRIPLSLSGGGMKQRVFVTQSPAAGRDGVPINYAPVSDRYFEVLGTRILRGRAIERQDVETEARVVVINQQMAARFWPDQTPLGQLIRFDKPDGHPYEVVGVAENGQYNELGEESMPYFFVPMRPENYGELAMVIRTRADAAGLAGPFRQTLRSLNADAVILELVTMREHMRQALYVQSLSSRLIGSLGTLGLLLAGVGIFGLMSFVAGKRTKEIGVRLALGAQRSSIFGLMVRYALQLTIVGLLLGTAAALGVGRVLRAVLVGVEPANLVVFAGAILVLLVVAFIAALVPSLRAVRVDPIVALRDE